VQTIHLKNLTNFNVFVPEIQVDKSALFLDNLVGYSYRNESFSQKAYDKAVEDKRWDEVYFRKTGKHWQGHEDHKDEAKAPPVIEKDDAQLDQEACLRLLGLKPGFSKQTLKKAYNERVKMNHPDKVPPHLDMEFRELAERKTKRINQAYELLKRTLA
jgi:hypothetical protein